MIGPILQEVVSPALVLPLEPAGGEEETRVAGRAVMPIAPSGVELPARLRAMAWICGEKSPPRAPTVTSFVSAGGEPIAQIARHVSERFGRCLRVEDEIPLAEELTSATALNYTVSWPEEQGEDHAIARAGIPLAGSSPSE